MVVAVVPLLRSPRRSSVFAATSSLTFEHSKIEHSHFVAFARTCQQKITRQRTSPSYDRGRANTAPSRTSTSNVAIGSVAGIQSGFPVRKSNLAPCRGQAIEQSFTAPPVNGWPSCEQTSSIAKKSSPIRTSRAGISSTRIDNRPPGGISLTVATRSKSDIFNVIRSL